MLNAFSSRRRVRFLAVTLCLSIPGLVGAQTDATSVRAVRQTPTERFAVSNGNRDWGPASIAGNIIVAGGPAGKAGLHAVDMLTGKLKWTYRPADINASVSTPPAIVRDLAIAPYGAANPGAVIAVAWSTGKAVWRGPDPAAGATVVAMGDMVYVQTKDEMFVALNAATGKEVWRRAFSRRRYCESRPVVADGVVYVSFGVDAVAGDASRPEGFDMMALDAKTGQEKWRHRAEADYGTAGVCVTEPVLAGTTLYGMAESRLYAIDRATGRDKWKAVETRAMVEGRLRLVKVAGLIDAGAVLVGVKQTALVAFDKASGKTAWELPGEYNLSAPSTAVAGNVLYFQGSPQSRPAPYHSGTLYALDLDTHAVLWSFTRPTAEKNWPFGSVTPVRDGLWVDSYKALVKLQQ
jgi:outer membrane protein assembly factor BamB